jgi:hypothetical protein
MQRQGHVNMPLLFYAPDKDSLAKTEASQKLQKISDMI